MSDKPDASREAVGELIDAMERNAWAAAVRHEVLLVQGAARLRALLAERDAAFHAGYAAGFDRGWDAGAEAMREAAAQVVDVWHGAEPTTEEHPQRLVWAVIKTKAETIRALPVPERKP